MTTFPGAFRGGLFTVQIKGLSGNLPPETGLITGSVESAHEFAGEPVGQFIRNQPIAFLTRTLSGGMQFSYFDDYYNRVWMIPTIVDFGPITATTSITVYMWNAYLRATTLTEVGSPVDPSLSLAGISMPLTLKPLQALPFAVWAMQEGDPDINATFAFTFSPFEVVNLRVTGIRARLWEFPPNWADPLEVTYEYRSEIFASKSGREQRRGLRQRPRKEISFSALAHDKQWRDFIRLMSSWQARPVLMPEFYRVAKLSADLDEAVAVAQFETIPDWLAEEKTIVFRKGKQFMVRTVTGIDGNSVALNAGAAGHWTKGTRIYPTVAGHLATRLQGRQHSNNTATISVSFASDPGLEKWPDVPPMPNTHRGRELWLKKPNWANAPTPEFQSPLDQLDYGVGRIDNFIPYDFNDRYHKAEYVGFTAGEVEEVLQFFRRNFGQVGEFFMPTYTEDLVIKSESPYGTSYLRIEGTQVAEDYADGLVYRDLIVLFEHGGWAARRVSNIYQVDDNEGRDSIVQVAVPWNQAIRPDNVKQICWLPLWRLASDSLTVQWLTDGAAQIAMSMKTLENLPAET